MNVSLTSEHVHAPVHVYDAIIYHVNISFTFSSPHAQCCLCHKCQQSGINLIHSASRIFPIPLSKQSHIQPHAPPCLLCYFILPP